MYNKITTRTQKYSTVPVYVYKLTHTYAIIQIFNLTAKSTLVKLAAGTII